MNFNVQLQPTTVFAVISIRVLLIGIVTSVFVCIHLESSSFAAVFRGVMFKQPATRIFPLGSLFTCLYIALHCLHCFVVTSFSG